MDSRRGATVLLVEDNPDHAELAQRALRKGAPDAQVVWSKDGQEALDLLARCRNGGKESRPDLVLLDIQMPKVSGYEVVRTIKADPELRTIPVVMMTTSDQSQDVAICYEAGANSYVTKPVSFTELIQRIESVKLYWLLTNRLPSS